MVDLKVIYIDINESVFELDLDYSCILPSSFFFTSFAAWGLLFIGVSDI